MTGEKLYASMWRLAELAAAAEGQRWACRILPDICLVALCHSATRLHGGQHKPPQLCVLTLLSSGALDAAPAAA